MNTSTIKTALTAIALVASLGASQAAHAQTLPSFDQSCANLQATTSIFSARVVSALQVTCSDPSLHALGEQKVALLNELLGYLSPAEKQQLLTGAINHGLSITNSCGPDKMCLYREGVAQVQRYQAAIPVVQRRAAGRVVTNVLQSVLGGLSAYAQGRAAAAPVYTPAPVYTGPSNCQAQPNGGGFSINCQ